MIILLAVLGAALGSFINVVIYRLPRKQSLIHPPSRCPHCGRRIQARDNIPLVGFLLLGGRCRNCREPIGWRYPLVELGSAGLLPVMWVRSTSLPDFIASGLLGLVLLALAFIDLEHQIIPNAISYPGIVLGLLLAVPQGRFADSVLTAAAAGAFFLLLAFISRGGMGGGDVKLATLLGAFLGWPGTAVALFVAFSIGAGVGLILVAMRRRGRKDPIPFGPALAVGGLVALLVGDQIVRWYLTL